MMSNLDTSHASVNFDHELLVGTVMRLVAEIYPGEVAHLESAAPDPTRGDIWQSKMVLSNGVRFRFAVAMARGSADIVDVEWLPTRYPIVSYDAAYERSRDGS